MIVRSNTPAYLVSQRGLGSFDTVAQAIQQQEGYYPGSLAYRNNNPGNLRPAGQPGCVASGGFCAFPDYQTGYQALLNQIALDASRGLSIDQFTAKYAPAKDNNNPASYAQKLAAALGLSTSDPLAAANSGSPTGSVAQTVSDYVDEVTSGDEPDLTAVYIGGGLLAAALVIPALFS